MEIAYITGLSEGTGPSGGTTSAIDTTGADFLAAVVAHYDLVNPVVFSDSKGNTWTPLTQRATGGGPSTSAQIYSTVPVSVGSGHTFEATNGTTYPSLHVMAFSGLHASPYTGQEAGEDTLSATSFNIGSVPTPSEDNCLIIAGIANWIGQSSPASADSGFTTLSTSFADNQYVGGGIAYLIQTTATNVDPTWTWGGDDIAVAIALAVFKSAAGGGGGAGQPTTRRWGGVPHLGTQKLRGGHRGGPWGYTPSGVIVPRHQEAA